MAVSIIISKAGTVTAEEEEEEEEEVIIMIKTKAGIRIPLCVLDIDIKQNGTTPDSLLLALSGVVEICFIRLLYH